jgi:hypothetical protein
LPCYGVKFINGLDQLRQQLLARFTFTSAVDRLQLAGQIANFAGPYCQGGTFQRVGGDAPIGTRAAIQSRSRIPATGQEQTYDLAQARTFHGVLCQVGPVENDLEISPRFFIDACTTAPTASF